MVEQDFLLSRAVAAIFEDNFLREHVAMRGGTVLHKGHLPPASRYSEDIDLVLVTNRAPGHIKRALIRVLEPIVGLPTESVMADIRLAVRNLVAKSHILRLTYTYDPLAASPALMHLKIEVNLNETKSLFPLVNVDIDVPDTTAQRKVSVVSYALDEMLGTKLRALLQRDHGRDLYDLWRAWDAASKSSDLKLDPARVGEAFRFYMMQEGSTFSAANVRTELDRRMLSKRFVADMEGYLPAGVRYDPQIAFNDFVRVFLPHIDAPPSA
jgi:predicted nucleotidyltransferase component of viral defense system